jgi:hypothetical protein
VHGPHEPIRWSQWYVQAILRQHDLGFGSERRIEVTAGSLRAIRTGLCEGLVRDQATWYRGKQIDHQVMLERTHGWELGLFLTVASACLLALVVSACYGMDSPSWFHDWPRALVCIAATLPAVAAAFHGIAVQGELHSIEKTYRRMAVTLQHRARALEDLGEDFTLEDLQREVAMASNAMLAEVQDWHRSYGDHPPPLA